MSGTARGRAERVCQGSFPVAVVGLSPGAPLGPGATDALRRARWVAGAPRHLAAVRDLVDPGALVVPLGPGLAETLDAIASAPRPACVLATGDPGFFGILRALAERVGPDNLEVHPAVSSVALAFARLGLPWDDATVVSAHGRPLAEAAHLAARAPKVALLGSPEAPPQAIGAALCALGAPHEHAAVCSRLGEPDEQLALVDLPGLAAGSFDPLSVVVLWSGTGVAHQPTLAFGPPAAAFPEELELGLGWALPDEAFVHRDRMLTKAEVRAVVLARLALPATGVLWDVGAGSGSVAIECARLRPSLEVHALDRDPDAIGRITANAAAFGVGLRVLQGEAPTALASLPDPDRVFIGGGGLDVLDAVLARLRPGGRVVATYAALGRARKAARRLGGLVQLGVARAVELPDGDLRLAAEHPVFVAFGPKAPLLATELGSFSGPERHKGGGA